MLISHDWYVFDPRPFSFSGSWSIRAKVWRLSARQSPKHRVCGADFWNCMQAIKVECRRWSKLVVYMPACVRFFGESNTGEHLNTQTRHMATVIHGSDTFLEPVWQCMNLKARLETKTYVRLNSSWHHPNTVLQSHLSCGLRQGIFFPTQDKVRSPSMRFSNALNTLHSLSCRPYFFLERQRAIRLAALICGLPYRLRSP